MSACACVAQKKCLLVLMDRVHEQLYAILLALGDDDDAVELALHVPLPGHDFPFDHSIVGGVRVWRDKSKEIAGRSLLLAQSRHRLRCSRMSAFGGKADEVRRAQ